MNRRDLLAFIAAATGTALIGAPAARAYDETSIGENLFSPEDAAFLNDVAEVILPETETPGARAADVGGFMTVYVSDCYTAAQQERFRESLATLRGWSEDVYGKPFDALSVSEKTAMIEDIARLARIETEKGATPHWFTPIHQLTLFGFFTSELGANEVLRYEPVPGEYIGDLDYDGGPAWAT